MYNRYVPQQDGTYQKNRIPTPQTVPQKPPNDPPPSLPCHQEEPAVSFLRNLLPKNLDTGDLLVIILLLLMAGDCEENKSNWLLTLALYLFL